MILRLNILRLIAVLSLADLCLAQKDDGQHKRVRKGKYPLQVHSMYRNEISKKTPKKIGEWSSWSPWSPCSRSCGGGITQQTRHCITRPADSRFSKRLRRRRQYQSNECIGVYKRIHLCNRQDCIGGRDFRYEQCAAFNNRKFKGNVYHWEPFLQAPDECALNCRPMGMSFYATLNKTVIDGTSCARPTTSMGAPAPRGTKGVCIDGYCKSVNSYGVVGAIDVDLAQQCSVCQQTPCKTLNGIYTRPDLPDGYSRVTEIPQGACRILIQQLKHTRNFLAVRYLNGTFLLNGDWKVSNSRSFQAAGTRFNYIKQDGNSLETVSSSGPLTTSIEIMVVHYQANPGIKYSYSIPDMDFPKIAPPLVKKPYDGGLEPKRLEPSSFNTLNQKDEARPLHTSHRRPRLRRKFAWKITGVSPCTKTCGGGIQTPLLTCVREHSQVPVIDKRCSHVEKPRTPPIQCNIDPCPATARWMGGYWGQCSVTCGEGVEEFIHECRQDVGNGRSVLVNEAACPKRPNAETRACNRAPCENINDNELPKTEGDPTFRSGRREWTVGIWSACSVTCGTGHRVRPVTCPSGLCHPADRPLHAEYCDMGECVAPRPSIPSRSHSLERKHDQTNWMLSEWSQCSENCGTGTQTRLAICPDGNCDEKKKPELTRACSSEKQCSGEWFTGPWGTCSDSCSGPAKQKREVYCIVKIRGQPHITNEMTCTSHLKPHSEQHCDGRCPARWFSGDWGQCEGNCPTGTQRRRVTCMEANGVTSNSCVEDDIPIGKRPCACQNREDHRDRYRPAQDEPSDRSCKDKIHNCHLAVRARLCQYPYYTSHCCVSCKTAQQDLLV
ncbi:thrombospondin type-1 domain-containing protein 4 [Aethina tumida]|uniref:thrombospondin type-1 domain-containing protein 4 n=1 Tax=Aethina tumida TaxID=116153 RepID=UPI00096B1736|nr:thrombospondin type-1 domain-containing protein 4 [Aethina tumida]